MDREYKFVDETKRRVGPLQKKTKSAKSME